MFFRILWSLASGVNGNRSLQLTVQSRQKSHVYKVTTHMYKGKSLRDIKSTLPLNFPTLFRWSEIRILLGPVEKLLHFYSTIFISSFLPSNLSVTTSRGRIVRVFWFPFLQMALPQPTGLAKPLKGHLYHIWGVWHPRAWITLCEYTNCWGRAHNFQFFTNDSWWSCIYFLGKQ